MAQQAGGLEYELKGFDATLRRLSPDLIAGPLREGMGLTVAAIQREAQTRAPGDTRRLKADIHSELDPTPPFPRWGKVGPRVFYAPFVEFGTGLFGPLKRRITPVRAKALAWISRDGRLFIRRSVAGMRPRPYMRPALAAAAKGPIPRIWAEAARKIGLEWRNP